MRCAAVTLTVMAAAFLFPACRPAAPALLSEEDLAAIRTVSEQFEERLIARDFTRLAELYTEDAVFMPPDQPSVQGRANIQSWMESFPPVTAADFIIDEIDGAGDIAYVRGRFTMTITPPGGEPEQFQGKYIEIRHRQADGSWLLHRDIFNSSQPPA